VAINIDGIVFPVLDLDFVSKTAIDRTILKAGHDDAIISYFESGLGLLLAPGGIHHPDALYCAQLFTFG